jgi:trigger factor
MEKEILEKIVVTPQEKSEVIISGELPYAVLLSYRSATIKALGEHIELDGFRKGHVPESVLVQKLGEMHILHEMAERALRVAYPEIVAFHNLDVVGYPNISLTKLAPENPLGFSITVAIMPEVTLPEYQKIAAHINSTKPSKEVTDEEVTKQIEDIMRQKSAYERLQKKAGANQNHVHDEHCNHNDEAEIETNETAETTPVELPPLTDDYVKTLGKEGQFTSVDDFKAKLREHLSIEKAKEVDSQHRAKITDAIIAETSVTLPAVMIEAEIKQMFAQMEDDLTRAQLKVDDYLSHIKKTRDDLRAEWQPSAEKRAKLQLVLNEIAKKESIQPDPSLVDHEVSHLLETYKDADEARVRMYVSSVLTNDAVMKMLEESK